MQPTYATSAFRKLGHLCHLDPVAATPHLTDLPLRRSLAVAPAELHRFHALGLCAAALREGDCFFFQNGTNLRPLFCSCCFKLFKLPSGISTVCWTLICVFVCKGACVQVGQPIADINLIPQNRKKSHQLGFPVNFLFQALILQKPCRAFSRRRADIPLRFPLI